MGYVYLTADEVVLRWRGSHAVRTLANWRSQGKGPPVIKIGNRSLYRLDLLEKWERKHFQNPAGK